MAMSLPCFDVGRRVWGGWWGGGRWEGVGSGEVGRLGGPSIC